MNFFTHIAISKIIYHNFKDRLYLRKRAFIYGNIKPDLTWGVMRNPHTWDNYFINVCRTMEDLVRVEPEDDIEFSIELGEICHYICDFFCLYHLNTDIFRRLRKHFFYEAKLHFAFRKLTKKEKTELAECSRNAKQDIASILTEMRADYFSKPSAMKKDISYALSTIAWVCKSLSCCLAASAEPGSDEEAEPYGPLPLYH